MNFINLKYNYFLPKLLKKIGYNLLNKMNFLL